MLSAKCVRIHGMRDERWTIRDKINQYRGILKLHDRDRKVRVVESTKLKRRVSKELKGLVTDVREYRGLVKDVEHGEKRRMRTVLQEHKDFQLAYENLHPNAIEAGVFQDSSLKRRQLDKLYYEKKKKMKEFFDLKLECAILSDKYEREQECLPNYVQQRLITGYQQFMAKQNAAKSVRTTYQAILNILHKDAIYFDAVLESLKEDRQSQCKVLLKATVMGQLAAENLDDTRQRYKLMASQVWLNMQERERTLAEVRSQVEDVWARAKSLVRVESDGKVAMRATERRATVYEESVGQEIKRLEETFDRVKSSLAVRSYEEFFSRIETQMKQRERLLAQFDENFKQRDSLLNSKDHAQLGLATLEHSMLTTTGHYKTEKQSMLEEIQAQKKREIDCTSVRKTRGELLVRVRAALQNMLAMLACVRETRQARTVKKGLDKKSSAKEKTKEQKVEEDEAIVNREAIPLNLRFEADALTLLAQVSGKANLLVAMSNVELNPNEEGKAKQLYQQYVADYRTKMKFGDVEPEPTGIFVEHEVIDSTILSRADIKLRSKQVVEANAKPE